MTSKEETTELLTRLKEDRFFTLCPNCAFEIDLRQPHLFVDDFYVHDICPVITYQEGT